MHQFVDDNWDNYFPLLAFTNNMYEFLCGHMLLFIFGISLRVELLQGHCDDWLCQLMDYKLT